MLYQFHCQIFTKKKYNKNPCERLHFQLHKILVKSSENLKLMNYEYKSSKYTLLLKAFRGLTEAIQGIAFSHFYCSVLEAFLLASTASANQGGMPYHTTASKNLFSKMELNPDENCFPLLPLHMRTSRWSAGGHARWRRSKGDRSRFQEIVMINPLRVY